MRDQVTHKQEDYKQQAQKIVEKAMQKGATDVEVSLSAGSGQSVTVRMGDLESLESNLDHSLSVTLYLDQQKGYASTSDLTDNSIDQVIDAAYAIAQKTQPDEYAGLPEKADLATTFPDLDLYHEGSITTEAATELAIECERQAMSKDKRIVNSDGASYNDYYGVRVLANSRGFLNAYRSSRHSFDCTVIAEENDHMQRDGSYTIARDPGALWSVERVAEEAAMQTISKLNAQKVPTCEVPVVFRYDVARSIIGHFLGAISGGALYRGQSFLVGSLGESLFPDWMTITDDPFVQKALASSPFDAEGVAVARRDIVTEGAVSGYLLGSYSARRLNMKTTGNAGGSHNVMVTHQDHTLEDLLAEMGTGLLVTDVIGQGVNLVTGDYSRGANGFWVENGMIQYPVEEITIASNLRDMFAGIQLIAKDIDDRSALKCGSILVNNMMLAGS